jgi:MerR family transcriptional regulator, light-induced transcriptional regulator
MYTIKEAAARCRLPIATVRVWEQRYGVVHPERTASGYRLYDDASVDRLIAMRYLVEREGLRPRQAATQVLAAGTTLDELVRRAKDLDAVAAIGPTDAPGAAARAGAEIDAFVAATGRLDIAAMERVLDDAFASERFESSMEHVIFPAMRAVGDAWARGAIDVAMEHAASETVRRRLARFYEAISSTDTPDVIVGLPPGGRHELGALAFAVAARRRGVNVLYLGADVPLTGWLTAVESTSAVVAILGVVALPDVAATAEVVAALRRASRPLTTAVGGPRAHELAEAAKSILLPGLLDEAVTVVQGMLARTA